MTPFVDRAAWAGLVMLLIAGAGCVRQEETFTQGRLETTCGETIPVCDRRASCVLDNSAYVERTFPGGLTSIVRTDTEESRLVVRFLLREMVSPGSEILVRAYDPGCSNFRQRRPQNVDLFERAGDDRILEFQLPLKQRGDHLLEVYSDMAADYTMTTTVESQP